jgi:hypothetical protein
MNTNSRAMRPGMAFVVVALFALAPAVASARTVRDSEEFSRFLAGARTEAVQVQQTAEEMFALKFSKVSWHTHAAKLEELKTHVNKLGEFVVNMNNVEAHHPGRGRQFATLLPWWRSWPRTSRWPSFIWTTAGMLTYSVPSRNTWRRMPSWQAIRLRCFRSMRNSRKPSRPWTIFPSNWNCQQASLAGFGGLRWGAASCGAPSRF